MVCWQLALFWIVCNDVELCEECEFLFDAMGFFLLFLLGITSKWTDCICIDVMENL